MSKNMTRRDFAAVAASGLAAASLVARAAETG